MTEAETFLLTLKEKFVWTTLITSDITHVVPRIVSLRHNAKAGFFVVTRKNQRKLELIHRNPGVTLSIFPGSGFVNAVVHCTAQPTQSKDDIENCWHDDLLKVNYKGKDDPNLVIILLTIHSVKLGAKIYPGHAVDYSKYVIDRKTPLKPLPTAPYQTAEAIAELKKVVSKDGPAFHTITKAGIYHNDRMMQLRHNEKHGFYEFTRKGYAKVTELQIDSNAALLCEIPSEGKVVVADVSARVCYCPDVLKALWTDDLKKHGLTGADDPSLAAILFSIRSVSVLQAATHETKVYVSEPLNTDRYEQILQKAAQTKESVYLNTVDDKNIPHSRLMWFIHYHPALGFLLTTRDDEKARHIRANPHVTVTCLDATTTDEYVFDALATVVSDPGRRRLHWSNLMKSAGYSGPEDTTLLQIALNVQKAEVRNIREFWKKYGRPEDGGKWEE